MTYRRYLILRTILFALLISCTADAVYAQDDSRFAVGTALNLKRASEEDARGSTGVGLLWRFGSGRSEGWGFKYGFSWYTADLDTAIGDSAHHEFGKLRVRPFMAGYGYSKRLGRVQVSAKVLGGFALTSFSLSSPANAAFQSTLQTENVRTSVSDPLVLKPEVSAWINLNDKIGLNISAGEVFARPEVTISGPHGVLKRRVRADMFMVKIGAVYSVF
jgi:hypothetical protein